MAKTETTTATEAPKKDKGAAFKKLANTRVTKALNAIAVIGNLSSKASYEYTDFQVEQIKKALEAEVAKTMARFTAKDGGATAGFALADAPAPTEAPQA